MKPIVEVRNLVKTFPTANGAFQAVDNISFEIQKGEIFAFLGPNGAGKSTTIKMMTSQLQLSSGDILIDGLSIKAAPDFLRQKIGLVAQHNNLDKGLTALENLLFHGVYFGLSQEEAQKQAGIYLKQFGLWERRNDFVKTFSGGMVQRLKIARALMHEPDILFLDEPTTGLDPAYRSVLWDTILTLNREKGTTILLTTHYMEEPEQFANRIGIINHGKIVGIGTLDELRKQVGGRARIRLESSDNLLAELDFSDISAISDYQVHGNILDLYFEHLPQLSAVTAELEQKLSGSISKLELATMGLNEIFITLTDDKE